MDRTDNLQQTFVGSQPGVPAGELDQAALTLAFELACLCCRLIRSDEVVLPSERQAVAEALAGHSSLDRPQLETVLDFVFSLESRELPPREELLRRTAAHPVADRRRLVDGLLAVAAADGQVHREEVALIAGVARSAGLSETDFHHLLRERGLSVGAGGLELPLAGEPVTIGRGGDNQIQLPGLSVSTHHARLVPTEDGWAVDDLGSATGTWVHGRRVRHQVLADGDLVRVENFCLRLDLRRARLNLWNQNDFLELSATDLTVEVRDRRTSRPRTILDRVSCAFSSGELIALMGPSGSGKTTLVNALLGSIAIRRGTVKLNGEACRGLLERHASRLGIVPQDDVVYGQLTVEEALFFSGALRAVPGVHRQEVRSELGRVLRELSLERIRDTRVGDALRRGISGGERKRVNLGQELLNPSTQILILDEPTTGLDPHTGLEIFRLLRRLADRGRLVIVVTHRVDEQTLALIDKVAVVGVNGRLAFFGSPREAFEHCGSASVAELFEELQQPQRATELAERYQRSLQHRPPGEPEEGPGDETEEPEEATSAGEPEPPPGRDGAAGRLRAAFGNGLSHLRRGLRQLALQTDRYSRVKWRDPIALAVNFGQIPLIVLGCWLVLHRTLLTGAGSSDEQLIPVVPGALPFILVIAAFWLGCVSSIRELVADQAVFRRERMAGLGLTPYLGSKLMVLGSVTVVQNALLVASTGLLFGLDSRHLEIWKLFATLTLTGWVGMTLGLFASALFRSTEAAVATLPLLLIPQLLFGGMLVSFDRMPPEMRTVSYAMASRWGVEGFVQAGEAGLGPGNQVLRDRCSLFTVPDQGSVCRNAFLSLLGLAHRRENFGPITPDGSLRRALAALALLSLAAAAATAVALSWTGSRR